MILTVPFSCTVVLHKYEANYSGSLTLRPEYAKPKTFYYLMLNPYGGRKSEFSVWEDQEMKDVYIEAIGDNEQKFNPRTGKLITSYDFKLNVKHPKMGVAYVICSIIMEAIYQSEILYGENKDPDKANKPHPHTFNHVWEHRFSGNAEIVAENYVEHFIKGR